ncbi:MAG: DUF5715 family protein [Acidobacteriota bacterium]|nr:DUF5715 family protein [Acidobacteriota bacterium]
MKAVKNYRAILSVVCLLSAVILSASLALSGWRRGGRSDVSYLPAALTERPAEVDAWNLAVEKVKADRGEPTGKQAKVDIPAQVRHYSDTRRFLAIQVAEVREHHIETPHDLVDLAAMIKRGEMVVLQPVTENYILFGVGGNADKDPFTHYESAKSVSLYNEAGLKLEYARIANESAKFQTELATLKRDLSALKKRERSERAKLQTQIVKTEQALKAELDDKEVLDRSYGNANKRQELFADYEALKDPELYRKVGLPASFDIENGPERRNMKVRVLSSLRPEALKVLDEVAASYREKFERPLPITSLVRPDEYQHLLSKTNPNATRIETPPHSTGLAFDILYRYMTAEEQSYVMAYLARLKDEGRIEVLRENRDHYHVFAFVDGARPDESLIAAALGNNAAAKEPRIMKQSHHSEKKKQGARATEARQRRGGKQAAKNQRRRTR